MSLQMRGVDHQAVCWTLYPRQFVEDRVENPCSAPAYEAVVQRLVWPIGLRRILPLKAVPNDIEDLADHPHIINSRNAVGYGEIRLDSIQLRSAQQKHALMAPFSHK